MKSNKKEKNKMKKNLEIWQEQAKKSFKCIKEPNWSFGQN
jgi:hypothetical protein